MRWDGTKLTGIGPFRETVELDLASLGDALLVAITGVNGAGKTTLLEAGFPGALDRSTPTRGDLLDLATRRDSMVESRFTHAGHSWTVRHLLDGLSSKSEAVVLCDGAPVLPDTKVRSFDDWRATALPNAALLLASTFGAQQARGFLEMKRTERVGIVLRLAGADHYEELAKQSRKNADEARAALELATARLRDEGARGGDQVEQLSAQYDTAATALEQAEAELTRANELYRLAEAEFQGIQEIKATAERAERERLELSRGFTRAQERLDELVLRARPHRELVAMGAEIRLAGERAALLRGELEDHMRARAEQERANAENTRRRQETVAAFTAAQRRRVDLNERIVNNRAVLADGDAIRAAVAKLPALNAQGAELDTKIQELLLERSRRQRDVEIERAAARTDEAKVAKARRTLEQAAVVEHAVADEARLQSELEAARSQVKAAESAAQELTARGFAGAEERISGLRLGLQDIALGPNRDDEHQFRAQEALDADDEAARRAEQYPLEVAAATKDLETARAAVLRLSAQLDMARRLTARAPEMAAAREELEHATKARDEAEARRLEAVEAEMGINAALEPLYPERQQIRDDVARLEQLAKRADPLARAETRLQELEPELAAVDAELGKYVDDLEALPQPAPVSAEPHPAEAELRRLEPLTSRAAALVGAEGALSELEPEIARARAALDEAERAWSLAPAVPRVPVFNGYPDLTAAQQKAATAREELARLGERLSQAQASAARCAELEQKRAQAELELADWNRLASDLGKDGLQALEVDAAGPELTELTNDLLHSCYGPRFTVRIDTQRASADGKKLLEGCDVNVIDTQEGRDGEAKTFSPGERVLLSEALSLALTMYGARRSGDTDPTIVRDESGAALSPENVSVYAAMLRRAGERMRASRILVISHTPAFWALCDARINVADRRVEIAA